MKENILIVEDDLDIANLERDYLELEGFNVDIITDGAKVLNVVRNEDYSLILLDVMLPHMNGYEICRHIREFSDVPIVIVTAKDTPVDIVRGLGLGSDDYVTKPFNPSVLVARVKASLSRYKHHKNIGSEITIDNLRIIPESRQLFKSNQEIKLPNREFELLSYLIAHPNTVHTKEDLFEAIWGLDSLADAATVTVHINRLREKIEDNPSKPKYIETVWGVGYRFIRS